MRREWSEMEVARFDITGGLWATSRLHGRAAVMGWGRGGLDVHDLRTSGVVGQVKKRALLLNKLAADCIQGVKRAFFLAAASGEDEIIKAMMKKNGDLTKNLGNNGILPLHKAALMGNKEIVQYLYGATQDEILDNDNDRIELLISLVNRSLYDLFLHINFGLIVVLLDIELDLVQRHPKLATA
ncbi:hypothetical protein Pint_12294 [Pistacia integerrima]|uniref:Uncharacterized protein n=1 Tax=Pistacia integerrima TaxID=434235 RepID=A0ACC0XJL3_9ROSI|nr:hypothetical protein Pint_12294 [Pistacia integerrima]